MLCMLCIRNLYMCAANGTGRCVLVLVARGGRIYSGSEQAVLFATVGRRTMRPGNVCAANGMAGCHCTHGGTRRGSATTWANHEGTTACPCAGMASCRYRSCVSQCAAGRRPRGVGRTSAQDTIQHNTTAQHANTTATQRERPAHPHTPYCACVPAAVLWAVVCTENTVGLEIVVWCAGVMVV